MKTARLRVGNGTHDQTDDCERFVARCEDAGSDSVTDVAQESGPLTTTFPYQRGRFWSLIDHRERSCAGTRLMSRRVRMASRCTLAACIVGLCLRYAPGS
ncbi:hypothetical protein [Burkholderia lata]|uniref:hypothetical protein n=1 Tax=Burkholderia lata (strain ATCC 17760 / DSM 23089 / LMG 22485 / NCIMB 9086 / R18194 / 383) TaxID=482957 RepID=UPI00158407BE|nr:hypothetical protein [Burkholderia lata]